MFSEKVIRQKIQEFIENIHAERYPQFEKRKIFINHLMLSDSEEYGTVYSVEFKVIGADVGAREPFGGFWSFVFEGEELKLKPKE